MTTRSTSCWPRRRPCAINRAAERPSPPAHPPGGPRPAPRCPECRPSRRSPPSRRGGGRARGRTSGSDTPRGQSWSLPPKARDSCLDDSGRTGAGPAADALSVVCSASVRGPGLALSTPRRCAARPTNNHPPCTSGRATRAGRTVCPRKPGAGACRCRRLRTGWKASPPRARPGRLPLKSPSRFRAHCRHWKRPPPMLPRRSRPARWSSNSERNTLQLSSATRA